jgi:hypothetical protein
MDLMVNGTEEAKDLQHTMGKGKQGMHRRGQQIAANITHQRWSLRRDPLPSSSYGLEYARQ